MYKADALCNTGHSSAVSFALAHTNYATSDALNGAVVTACGDRDPLDQAAKDNSITTTFEQAINIGSDAPFKIDFAGFRQGTPSDDLEASKASPLAWNAGLDGSFVSLTETEHSQCTAAGAGYTCQPRSFKLSLCRELRPEVYDYSSGSVVPAFGNFQPVETSFFVELKDADSAYAQINDHYEFSCPEPSELTAISNRLYNVGQTGLNTLTCEKMSTKVDANGHAISCSDTASNPECDTKGTRLLYTITTASDMGAEMFRCPVSLDTQSDADFENLPFIIFTNRDDQGVVNLSRRPHLVIQNDKTVVGTSTCSYGGTRSSLRYA